MSGLCTLRSRWPFFHVVVEPGLDIDHAAIGQGDDGNLARMSGRPTGGIQLGEASCRLPPATSGNWSGLSTDTRLMSPVWDDLGVAGGAPSAGLNFFLHAVRERHRQQGKRLR
jgi:hypothetical protein